MRNSANITGLKQEVEVEKNQGKEQRDEDKYNKVGLHELSLSGSERMERQLNILDVINI